MAAFTGKTPAEVAKLIKGKKVRIVNGGSNHGQPIGTILEAKAPCVYTGVTNAIRLTTSGSYYHLTDLELVEETKQDLEDTLVSLDRQKVLVEAKLDYLKATKQETFDETEFKVWNTLQVLKGKKNDLEKAKAIASLING